MTAEPLPDVYAELHTIRYLDLGKLRNSISDECTVAIAFQDEEYVRVLTQADDDVRAAQRLLARAAARIFNHHEAE